MIDSLIQRLCDHAQGQPKRPAVLEVGLMGQERVLTWSQLHAASHRFSERVLSAQDSAAGAVLVSSETGLEMLVSILGCIWAGQPVLPVAANVPPGELVRLAGRARVVLAIGDRETCRALRSDVQECWSIDGVELDVTSDGPTELPHGSGSLLLQSSGTTGMPKIVRRCEQAIARIGRNCSRAVGLDREDIILVCIPLYHSYGIDMGVSAVGIKQLSS